MRHHKSLEAQSEVRDYFSGELPATKDTFLGPHFIRPEYFPADPGTFINNNIVSLTLK
jgi:hypothetical protein